MEWVLNNLFLLDEEKVVDLNHQQNLGDYLKKNEKDKLIYPDFVRVSNRSVFEELIEESGHGLSFQKNLAEDNVESEEEQLKRFEPITIAYLERRLKGIMEAYNNVMVKDDQD